MSLSGDLPSVSLGPVLALAAQLPTRGIPRSLSLACKSRGGTLVERFVNSYEVISCSYAGKTVRVTQIAMTEWAMQLIRDLRNALLVGRENVIAGVDCGFAQGAFTARVHPTIAWAKLKSLAEGAALASQELWQR